MLRWDRIVLLLRLLHHPVRPPPLVVLLLLQLLLHLPVLLQQSSDVEAFLLLVQADILKGKCKPQFLFHHSPAVERRKQEEAAENIFYSLSTVSPSPAPSFASGRPGQKV